MANKILVDAVQRCRREFPSDCEFLTDWQIHSANLVASAVLTKAQDTPYDAGPRYLPFPTGSGKTIGAKWGILRVAAEFPDKRICFLTPYQNSVDQVYGDLVRRLGGDVVGMYYSGAFVDKATELQKRIVILTHQFVPHNKGALDDRDIFVIDEAIYSTAQVSLQLADFSQALTWATSHGLLPEEFEQANKFANDLYDRLKEDEGKRFFAAPRDWDYNWAKAISDLDLSGALSQTVANREAVAGVQIFCEALTLGLVFLDRGTTPDPKRYSPTFNAAILGIPKLDQTVVLTATGGLIYDIAGSIQISSGAKGFAVPATYDDLTLVQLPDPAIQGNYKTWSAKSWEVTDYLDWLLPKVAEPEAYLTMPLAVYDKCLREYFGLGHGDLTFPATVQKHGKTLHLSHHQLAIGTNAFKDCPAVIYLWPNHLPKKVVLQEQSALEGKHLTDESLIPANSRMQSGPFARMRDAKYLDNIIQQIGRGRMRQINGDGAAGKMTAYLLIRPTDFIRLKGMMTHAQTTELAGYAPIQKPVGRLARVITYLDSNKGQDIPVAQVAEATGIEAKNIKKAVEGNEWDIEIIGFAFEAGDRGRGKGAVFRWITTTDQSQS